nr:hypothetical protein BaRGS_026398 [Batillaria attramentaria]
MEYDIQKLEVRKEKKTALNTSRTRRAKAKAQEEYTAADREVKRSIRKDKRDYIDNLASQAEEAARQGNIKDLYQVTKKFASKISADRQTSEGQERAPTDQQPKERLKRWAEHQGAVKTMEQTIQHFQHFSEALLERAGQEPAAKQILRRK